MSWPTDSLFLCDQGKPTIKLNTFPNNLDEISTTKKFIGRKKELDNLNHILRRMATRASDSINVCTIIGIGGQGKVSPESCESHDVCT